MRQTGDLRLQPHDAVLVRFHNQVTVPVDEAFSYADQCLLGVGYPVPVRIYWRDGSYSYAKGSWDGKRPGVPLVRIAAGPAGDVTILER